MMGGPKSCSNGRPIGLLLALLLVISTVFTAPPLSCVVAISDDSIEGLSDYSPIDVTDGYANLQEGSRLFALKQYNEASVFLWRAVLLQEQSKDESVSSVDYLPRQYSCACTETITSVHIL